MDASTSTVPELAAELGVNAKAIRAWMRQQGWRGSVELGNPWTLTDEQVAQLRADSRPRRRQSLKRS